MRSLLVVVTLAVMLLPACDRKDGTSRVPTPRATEPVLAHPSFSWTEETSIFRLDGSGHEGAALPLGNGRVFAVLGQGDEPWALSQVQSLLPRAGESQGRLRVGLTRDGSPLPVSSSTISAVRSAAMATSRLEIEGAVLHLVDGAPPGLACLLRHVTITARQEEAPLTFEAIFTPETGMSGENVRLLVFGVDAEGSATLHKGKEDGGLAARVLLSELDLEGGADLLVALVLGNDLQKASDEVLARVGERGRRLLDDTQSYWETALRLRPRFGGMDPRIDETVERCLVNVLAQRVGRTGPFASLLRFRGLRLDEQWDVARALQCVGFATPARDALSAMVRVIEKTGTLVASYPVESLLAEPIARGVVVPPKSAEDREAASLLVLLHELLLDTEDLAPQLYERWPLLTTAVMPALSGTPPPPGRGGSLASTDDLELLGLRGEELASLPLAGSENRRELETALLAHGSLSSLDRLSKRLDLPGRRIDISEPSRELRRWIEATFHARGEIWSAREPETPRGPSLPPQLGPGLAPLLTGFETRERPSARHAIQALLETLASSDGDSAVLLRWAPGCRYVRTRDLARLVRALADIEHPALPLALETLLRSASPLGNIPRLLVTSGGGPSLSPDDSLDLGATAQTLLAVIEALVAPRLQTMDAAFFTPRLLPDQKRMKITSLRLGSSLSRIIVEETSTGRVYEFQYTEGDPPTVGIDLVLPTPRVRAIRVNGRNAAHLIRFEQGAFGGVRGRLLIEEDLEHDTAVRIELEYTPSTLPRSYDLSRPR